MSFKKELPAIFIVSLPFIYLAYVWDQLPDKVPMHWNLHGEITRYGSKLELILIPIFLPLLIYAIFLVAPRIDPKDQLKKMGNKFQVIKLIVTTLMTILALFIIHTALNQSFANPNYVVLLVGVLYIIFGNYFKIIKANYFIGIRTPWTLESETVWKRTHELGGKMWFIGGLIVVITSLIFKEKHNYPIFFIITGIITIVPIVYSYIIFKKEKNTAQI